jgi:uncharacterized protein YecE (DUF72 family)
MKVKIGTSGYSFDSWAGIFYPPGLSPRKRLEFYSTYFSVVEINVSFYRLLPSSVFEGMAKKVPGDFSFMVKMNRRSTHDGRDADIVSHFRTSIRPLVEAGKLEGILAQFPWNFRNTKANRAYIQQCRNRLSGYPYFAEFRHRSWLDFDLLGFLRENRMGFVSVDEPQIGGMMPPVVMNTGDVGYIRLHGRNEETWWGDGPRYDYWYSLQELKAWGDKVKALAAKTEKTFLFFNNCHVGQAVKNAQVLQCMLNL